MVKNNFWPNLSCYSGLKKGSKYPLLVELISTLNYGYSYLNSGIFLEQDLERRRGRRSSMVNVEKYLIFAVQVFSRCLLRSKLLIIIIIAHFLKHSSENAFFSMWQTFPSVVRKLRTDGRGLLSSRFSNYSLRFTERLL